MYLKWLLSGNDIGIPGVLLLIFVRLLIAAVIILFVIFIVRYNMHRSTEQHSNEMLQVLNERLVRGELTIEEYQRLKMEILNQ